MNRHRFFINHGTGEPRNRGTAEQMNTEQGISKCQNSIFVR